MVNCHRLAAARAISTGCLALDAEFSDGILETYKNHCVSIYSRKPLIQPISLVYRSQVTICQPQRIAAAQYNTGIYIASRYFRNGFSLLRRGHPGLMAIRLIPLAIIRMRSIPACGGKLAGITPSATGPTGQRSALKSFSMAPHDTLFFGIAIAAGFSFRTEYRP